MEKITGESYRKFVQENLFTPLAMKDSGYDSNSAVIPHHAMGYVSTAGGYQNAGYIDMTIPFSAGALYSTVDDLLRWEQGLFGGKLLSAASLQKMTTPFKNNYAFGLFVNQTKGSKEIWHGGGIEGFNTFLAYYPEDKLTVACLGNVNGDAPELIGRQLAALAHGEKVELNSERKEITVSPGVLASYVGTYELQPGINAYIRLEGDHLTGQLSGQPKFPLFARTETKFFLKVVDAQIDFIKNDQGAVTAFVLHQNGIDQTATKKSAEVAERTEVKLPSDVLTQYPGKYKLSGGPDFTVSLEDGELQGQITGQPPFRIFAEAKDKFFLKAVDAQIEFVRNDRGAVTGLILHQGPVNEKGERQGP